MMDTPQTRRVYYIIWFFNLKIKSESDEGYTTNTSCVLYYLVFQS